MRNRKYGTQIEYDTKGNVISIITDINADEVIYKKLKYDSNNRIISELTNEYNMYYEYDDEGRLIHVRMDKRMHLDLEKYMRKSSKSSDNKPNDYKLWVEEFYEYDSNNNLRSSHIIDNHHDEEWYKYDQFGNIIYKKTLDDDDDEIEEFYYEYDISGRPIYLKNILSKYIDEEWYKYNEKGKQVIWKQCKTFLTV